MEDISIPPNKFSLMDASKKEKMICDKGMGKERVKRDFDEKLVQEKSIEKAENEDVKVRPEIFAVPENVPFEEHMMKVRALKAEKTSLQLRMWVLQGEGERVSLTALIDTGCEVNLVRRGLIPSQYFSASTARIRLVTANGEPLGGGNQQVKLRLITQGHEEGEVHRGKLLVFDTLFYEADISVDIILSYGGCIIMI